MSFNVGTLKAWVEKARASFRAELQGTDAWLWPNNVYASGKVIGGLAFAVALRLKFVLDQAFVLTARGEFLDRHGQQYGIGRLPAQPARGFVYATGVAGTVVPVGSGLARSDGALFVTTATATLQGNGVAEIPVEAVDAGFGANTVGSAPLTWSVAIDDLDPEASVTDEGLGGGADQETDEPYRERILFRLRYPPHAGTAEDYWRWARELPGISRVWIEPLAYGDGTVGVWFMMDDVYPNGIPQAADALRLQAYVDGLRPACARVVVATPDPVPLKIKIGGIPAPGEALEAAVEAEILKAFRSNVSVSLPTSVYLVQPEMIRQAIGRVVRGFDWQLVEPAHAFMIGNGQIPTVESIEYVG